MSPQAPMYDSHWLSSGSVGTPGASSGTGPLGGTSNNVSQKTQVLITPAELTSMGIAGGVVYALYLDNGAIRTGSFRNFTIKVGQGTQTSFEKVFWNSDRNFFEDLTTIYSSANQPLPNSIGDWKFNFNMPFIVDGSKSLLIEFCYDNLGFPNPETAAIKYSTGVSERTVERRVNYTGACNSGTGTFTNNRPRIKFQTRNHTWLWTDLVPIKINGNEYRYSIPSNTFGSYTFSGRAVDIHGCTTTVSNPATFTSTLNPSKPAITASHGNNVCSLELPVTLTAPEGFQYLWSNGARTRTISVNEAGSYTVQTISNACTSVASDPFILSITQSPTGPTVSTTAPTQYECSNQARTVPLHVQTDELKSNFNIGAGGSSGTAAANSFNSPFAGHFGGVKSQHIYTAASLTNMGVPAGWLTGLILDVKNLNQAPNFNNFTLKIGTTTLSAFANLNFVTGLTTVRTASSLSPPTATGEWQIDFDTPFNWDGTSNLVVEFCFNNNNGGTTNGTLGTDFQGTTPVQTVANWRVLNNSSTICNETVGGTRNVNRAKIKFVSQPYTLFWDNPNIQTTANPFRFNYNIPANFSGNAEIAFRAVRSGQCTSAVGPPLTIAVTPPAAPTITASGPTTVCFGQAVTLQGPATSGTYLWSNGATTQNIQATLAGAYSLRVVENGCTSAVSNTINIIHSTARPVISHSGNLSICDGSTVTLSGPAGHQYLWSTGETTRTIVVASPSTVSLRTIVGACTSQVSEPITIVPGVVPNTPSISASGPTSFCNSSVTLLGPTAHGYLWSNGETTQNITVSSSGNYSLQTISEQGCKSPASNIIIVTNQGPEMQVSGNLNVFLGDSTTLTVTGALNYTWSPATGLNTTAGAVVKASPSVPTTYTITGINENGCMATTEVTITPFSFSNINAGLPNLSSSSVAWADYDNDGDLDVVLAGFDGTNRVTQIWRNNGGANPTFTNINAGITGVERGSLAWGDYDNDGDLDLVISGTTGSARVTQIWRNNGGANPTFTNINAGITGVDNASLAWGDYDNDGDLDLVISGSSSFGPITQIWRNSGGPNPTFTNINAGITGVGFGSITWGDYDNDGDLDLIVSGGSVPARVTQIWRNNGGANPIFTNINAGITGVDLCSNSWGDFDNDGDLDLVVSGWTGSSRITRVYRNNGGTNPTFTYIYSGITSINYSSIAWGDYDNDGDLDLLLTGSSSSGSVTQIWRNNGNWTNAKANSIVGLNAQQNACSSVKLQWAKALDQETPQDGLNYNIRVSQFVGGVEKKSPMANTITGFRRIAELGKIQWSDSGYVIHNLAPGTYYWAVQAIDGGLQGGEWSEEHSFTIIDYSQAPSITTSSPPNICIGGSLTLSGPTGYSYLWSNGATTREITVNQVGSYSLRTIALGCTSAVSEAVVVSVVNNDFPIVGNSNFCDGDSTLLTAPEAVSYLWSNGGTTRSIWVKEVGTYSVRITLVGGCQFSSALFSTIQVPKPTISISGHQSFPIGGSTTLTASGAEEYTWSPSMGLNTTSGATVIANPVESTTYTVVGTSSSGCVNIKQITVSPASFTNINAGLPNLSRSSTVWGDYDNDGDLDLAIAGWNGSSPITQIWRNNGELNPTFTNINTNITGVSDNESGGIAWGDYDNDGDLDIVISGYNGSNVITQIWRNNGGPTPTFTNINAGITGISSGSLAWGDYDNDGDLDLVISGPTGFNLSNGKTEIWRNNGGPIPTFTNINAGLPNLVNSTVKWGDYDNDGDIDLAILGSTSTETLAQIWRNNGGSNPTFTNINAEISGLNIGNLEWVDYDNDGDLDLTITGIGLISVETQIWQNSGGPNPTFTKKTFGFGGYHSSLKWADYDNDGDLDLAIAGSSGTNWITEIWRNNGESNPTFTYINSGIVGAAYSEISWGDFDNDGDLDLLLTGNSSSGAVTQIWRNNGNWTNAKANSIAGLNAQQNACNSVKLNWAKALDQETPQDGLNYNIRVSQFVGGVDKKSPMANTVTGFRRIAELGKIQWSDSGYVVRNLAPGTYYWAVQAIDGGLQGGEWSEEHSFTIIDYSQAPILPFSNNAQVCIGTPLIVQDVCNDCQFVWQDGFRGRSRPIHSGGGVYRVKKVINDCESPETEIQINTFENGTFIGQNSNWHQVENWCGGIPTDTSNVVFQPNATILPEVSQMASVHTITIPEEDSIIVHPNAVFNLGGSISGGKISFASGSKLRMVGSTQQRLALSRVASIEISNPAGLSLERDLTVQDSIIFNSGSINTNNFRIYLHPTAEIIGETAQNHIAGKVAKRSLLVGRNPINTLGLQLSAGEDDLDTLFIERRTETPVFQGHQGVNFIYTVKAGVSPTSGRTICINLPQWATNGRNLSQAQLWYRALGENFWRKKGGVVAATEQCADGTCTYSVCGETTHFSEWTVSDESNPLPVELAHFVAYRTGEKVNLQWQTLSEVNNKGFEIHRSWDGKTFNTIGFQEGRGNSSIRNHYRFEDLNRQSAYYRLQQVDFNGQTEFGPTIYVKGIKVEGLPRVYPNPFYVDFNLILPTFPEDNSLFSIHNLIGQEVRSGQLLEQSTLIDLKDLPAGLYTLKVTGYPPIQLIKN